MTHMERKWGQLRWTTPVQALIIFGLIKDGFDTKVIVHVESDNYFDTALTAQMVALIP